MTRVGQYLTGEGMIINAHERKFEKKQLFETIDETNKALREWSGHAEVIKLHIRTTYPDGPIQVEFGSLSDALDKLTEDVEKLQDFATNGPSKDHHAATIKCRSEVGEIERQLDALTTAMSQHVTSLVQNSSQIPGFWK